MMTAREDIDRLFREALIAKIREMGHGAQTWIARRAEVSPQEVNRIAKGRIYGSERVKRDISKALGYEYEEFLDLARGKKDPRQTKEVLSPYRSRKDNAAIIQAAKRILDSDTPVAEALRATVLALEEAVRILKENQDQRNSNQK